MNKSQITIVVGLVINQNGEILLPRRNQPDIAEIHNKLEFPGGGIEHGETPEAAVIREVKEETGLDVEIVRLLPKVYSNLWEYGEVGKQVFILAYECKPIGGNLGSSDAEIGELKYFAPEDIDYTQALPKTKEIIELLASS
ncbi:MAG TPA: NUDIX hydrolase [Candidatus Limnocylindria bacterium]|nr:NUDIX hydrolase [Candidatus Limnocylindria bacterium]